MKKKADGRQITPPVALCPHSECSATRRRHGRPAAGAGPGNTHRIHALPGRRDGSSTPGGWHRGLLKIHVMAHAVQLFHGASAPPHGLAAHGYALADHVHSVAAGGTA